mgnify:CR=1 FL=1
MKFKHLKGELVLVIDDPYEQESIGLYMFERQVLDFLISQGRIGDSYTSCWIGSGKLPWGIHADNVEEAPAVLHLLLSKFCKIKCHHVGLERHCEKLAVFFYPLYNLILVCL